MPLPILVSGFGNADLPEWVKDQFNEYTTLPHGPLEMLPVPVEGEIVGAEAHVPSDGSPSRWAVRVLCAESLVDVMTFYEEFLPLSGYELIGVGYFESRRNWLARRSPRNGVVVFRTGEFLGRLVVRTANEAGTTEVLVELAHQHHPEVRDIADRHALRSNTAVSWTLRP